MGDPQRALEHLSQIEPQVVDKISLQETRAALLLQLRMFDEARVAYDALLARNPEHCGFHAGRQAAELRTTVATERWLNEAVDADAEKALRGLYERLQI
eukprot:5864328-Pleurochrysis_carterae.AAC.1